MAPSSPNEASSSGHGCTQSSGEGSPVAHSHGKEKRRDDRSEDTPCSPFSDSPPGALAGDFPNFPISLNSY